MVHPTFIMRTNKDRTLKNPRKNTFVISGRKAIIAITEWNVSTERLEKH
jgi:hypothetical protein